MRPVSPAPEISSRALPCPYRPIHAMPSPARMMRARRDFPSPRAVRGRVRHLCREVSNLLAAAPLWPPTRAARRKKPKPYRRQSVLDRTRVHPHRGHLPICSPAAKRATYTSARRFRKTWITRVPPIRRLSRTSLLPRRTPWRRSTPRDGTRASRHPHFPIPHREPRASRKDSERAPTASSEPGYLIPVTSDS